MELSKEEYLSLPLGEDRWSFDDFGLVSQDLVLQCCADLQLKALATGKVLAAWKRHPSNLRTPTTGRFFLFFLFLSFLTLVY
jgi:hypothetical protein